MKTQALKTPLAKERMLRFEDEALLIVGTLPAQSMLLGSTVLMVCHCLQNGRDCEIRELDQTVLLKTHGEEVNGHPVLVGAIIDMGRHLNGIRQGYVRRITAECDAYLAKKLSQRALAAESYSGSASVAPSNSSTDAESTSV